jgi:hypothetical protein
MVALKLLGQLPSGQHCRHIHPNLPPLMHGHEAAARQRAGQPLGQAYPVGQQPQRDRPSQRHHTRSVTGD